MNDSSEDLAVRAAKERLNLRASIDELKSRVTETLDVERQVGRHALPISAVAAFAAATLGYGLAGLFTRQ